MWLTFVIACLAAAIALYLPGYLLWRAFRFERLLALCTAPVASVAIIGVAAIVFEKASIPANAGTIGLCTIAICCIPFILSCTVARNKGVLLAFPATTGLANETRKGIQPDDSRHERRDWIVLAAYVVFGFITVSFVFLANIGSPEAFFSRWDNQTHLTAVRAFLDSGTWSSLAVDQYLAAPKTADPYLSGQSFYPAALHDIVCFVCSLTSVSVPCGFNAVNTVFVAIVVPASLFSLIKSVFPGERFALAAGAVTAGASAVFPWWLFIAGPLYPNFAGFALVPACAGCCIALLKTHLVIRKLPSVAVLVLCIIASLALLQPNTLFYFFIIIAAFGSSLIYHGVRERKGALPAVGAVVLFAAAVVVVWIAFRHVPLLQAVIGYEQSTKKGIAKAFINLIGLVGTNPLYAIAALAGIIACFKKRLFWIVIPALFMAAAYVFARLDPAGIGNFIGGFWYTDIRRLGPCFGFSLIPLAAYGLGLLLKWISSKTNKQAPGGHKAPILAGIVAMTFFGLNLFPSFEVEILDTTHFAGFGKYTDQIYRTYNPATEHNYSTEEVEFVDRVKSEIGEYALVINQPNDGSTFAYAINHLNTYYRHCRVGNQTDDSKAIRTKLADYSSNSKVQKAVADIGAEYVLQLDQGATMEDGSWLPQYKDPKPWKGIDAIRDDTPGFTLVLSDGDMRLYRIDAIADSSMPAAA